MNAPGANHQEYLDEIKVFLQSPATAINVSRIIQLGGIESVLLCFLSNDNDKHIRTDCFFILNKLIACPDASIITFQLRGKEFSCF